MRQSSKTAGVAGRQPAFLLEIDVAYDGTPSQPLDLDECLEWERGSVRADPKLMRKSESGTPAARLDNRMQREDAILTEERMSKRLVAIDHNSFADDSDPVEKEESPHVGRNTAPADEDWAGKMRFKDEQIRTLKQQLEALGEQPMEEVVTLQVSLCCNDFSSEGGPPVKPCSWFLRCSLLPSFHTTRKAHKKLINETETGFKHRHVYSSSFNSHILTVRGPGEKKAKANLREAIDACLAGDASVETEQALAKWDRYVTNHPEHIEAQAEEERKWEQDNTEKNNEALYLMKTFVPPDIFHAGLDGLKGGGLPPALAKRVFDRKVMR